MSKQFRDLLRAVLFISFVLQVGQLEAAEPLITIGKPPLGDILYSPDGRFLATLVNPYVKPYVELLDAETFVPIKRIDEAEGHKLAFSPNGALFAVFGRKTGIQIWEVDSQRLLETIPVDTEIAAFSLDGRWLAYAQGDTVFLWDMTQKQTVQELTDGEQVTEIAFHPNRTMLAVGQVGINVTLWDIETGHILSRIDTVTLHQKILRFSPDGTLLAVGTKDDAVRLFDVIKGDIRYARVPNNIKDVHDLGFTPDGRYFLVGEGNGNLRILHVATQWKSLLGFFCRIYRRGAGLDRCTLRRDQTVLHTSRSIQT